MEDTFDHGSDFSFVSDHICVVRPKGNFPEEGDVMLALLLAGADQSDAPTRWHPADVSEWLSKNVGPGRPLRNRPVAVVGSHDAIRDPSFADAGAILIEERAEWWERAERMMRFLPGKAPEKQQRQQRYDIDRAALEDEGTRLRETGITGWIYDHLEDRCAG